MNQIVFIKDDNNSKELKKKRLAFKTQFLFSIVMLVFLLAMFFYIRHINRKSSEKNSSYLSNSYQVYRLYSDNNDNYEDNSSNPYVIGNIEIPKINISYPILSTLNEELLKISPCRFYGQISDNSNLCIAGHNFDNDSFFSKINSLATNDEIIIIDKSNFKYTFLVFDNYEVDSSDLSPIYSVTGNNKKELTLVTCNNQNNKRIIIKAKLTSMVK